MFSWRSVELLCTCASAFAYVEVPSCPAVFCEALAPVLPAGVCPPMHFTVLFVRLRQCMCFSSVAEPLQSVVLFSICGWIPCILYQCDGCSSSLLRGGSWLGCQDLWAMEEVSSRSWLPIHYFPIVHNALCLPPKFCINYCCEILFGCLHVPKSILQQ